MNSSSWKIIDGGLATELCKKGFALDQDPLWSARLLHSNPDAVIEVHESYLEAGSNIIISGSYQATIEGFVKYLQISVAESETVIERSVHLCELAREKFYSRNRTQDRYDAGSVTLQEIQIAGSVGPYGAVLADGAEYHGNYVEHMSEDELINWHRPRVSCLVRAGCDMLAFETIPSTKEGVALIKLLKEFPAVKAWISFSCQHPTQTAHREKFSDCVKSCVQMNSNNQLLAIGVNCCPPDYVASLVSEVVPHAGTVPIIAYPNSGETFASGVGWNGEAKPLHVYVEDWVRLGVRWFGGCCRTGPGDILKIKTELQKNSTDYQN